MITEIPKKKNGGHDIRFPFIPKKLDKWETDIMSPYKGKGYNNHLNK